MTKPYFEKPEVEICPNCGNAILEPNKLLKSNWIQYCRNCKDDVDLFNNGELMREGQKRGL